MNNKFISAAGYFIFVAPLMTDYKNHQSVKYHLKQSIGLLIFALALQGFLSVWGYWALPFKTFLMWLIRFILLYLAISGAKNAIESRETPLPWIGHYSSRL